MQVLLGPPQLYKRINSKLAYTFLNNTLLTDIQSMQPIMQLDLLELIEAVMQENQCSFVKQRLTLLDWYQIYNGLLLY